MSVSTRQLRARRRLSAKSMPRRSIPCAIAEILEPRQLLAAASLPGLVKSGGEVLVNTYTSSDQDNPAIAMDAAGDCVVVWASYGQDGNSTGVYAQRYLASGQKAGGEFRVNTYTTGQQTAPAVAMDSDGDFVVAWSSYGQDGSYTGVFAQRFTSAGQKQGSEFRVNTYTNSYQDYPAVAIDAAGDFVVAWASYGQDGSSTAIVAQRYNSSGAKVGGEFQANTYTYGMQTVPAVAMAGNGNFVIAWTSVGQDGSEFGNYAQLYAASGSKIGGELLVNTYIAGKQAYPSAAMDADGDFVIAWQSYGQDGSRYGIYAQRYDKAGRKTGGEFRVNTYPNSDQDNATVAMDSAGDFIVAWASDSQDGSSSGVYARRYDATGAPDGIEFLVNTTTAGQQTTPAVAMDALGDVTVAWAGQGQDSSGNGVYLQKYALQLLPAAVGDRVWLDTDFDGIQDTGESGFEGATVKLFTSAGALISTTTTANGGQYRFDNVQPGVYYVEITRPDGYKFSPKDQGSNDALDSDADPAGRTATFTLPSGQTDLSRDVGLIPVSSISGAVFDDADANGARDPGEQPLAGWRVFLDENGDDRYTGGEPSAVTDAQGAYTLGEVTPGLHRLGVQIQPLWVITTPAGGWADADVTASQALTGCDFGLHVNAASPSISPAGSEFVVNTYTDSDQDNPAVAVDAAGDYTIVWASYGQDGSSTAIVAQRYNSAGAKIGGEFQANTYTDGMQTAPAIAMAGNGNFVITWTSVDQDGSEFGNYAQLYDASGSKIGGEFLVNTTTAGRQAYPSAAMDADGDFVIAWASQGQDGDGYGVYAQRYTAAGEPAGSEFRVNSYIAGDQDNPAVAMDAAGNFNIVWASYGEDGSESGVYAQHYNAAGNAIGGEFRVNTFTQGKQSTPDIAMDSAGDFVIAWASADQDGNGNEVYAQRYNADGYRVGGEFRVNTFADSDQDNPAVAMDAAGNFVITWASFGQDGDASGIYAQAYGIAGQKLGGEFQVNQYTSGKQCTPDIAMAGQGSFIITWASELQDGSGNGIYARQFLVADQPLSTLALSGGRLVTLDGSDLKVYPAPDTSGVPMTFPAGAIAGISILDGSSIIVQPPDNGSLSLPATSIQGAAELKIAGTDTTVRLAGLSLSSDARVDLGQNDIVLTHSDTDHGAALVEKLRLAIRSALVGGGDENPWTGPGLTSTAARDNENWDTAIAVFNNDDGEGYPWLDNYNGLPLDQNSIILKYTYFGDSNADGVITGDDFAAATSGWFDQMTGIAPIWMTGDFDYDQKVTADDFALLTNSWFSQDRANPLAATPVTMVDLPSSDQSRNGERAVGNREYKTPMPALPLSPAKPIRKPDPGILLVDDLAILA